VFIFARDSPKTAGPLQPTAAKNGFAILHSPILASEALRALC